MTTPSDQRPPIGIALEWVSRILAVVVVMVVPGLAGQWLDDRWGCRPLLTLLGFAFGLTAAIWYLIAMTKPVGRKAKPTGGPGGKTDRSMGDRDPMGRDT